jgi:hypothetical protein
MRRDDEMKSLIWGESKTEYFCCDGWTGFRKRRFFCPSGKSARRFIRALKGLQSVLIAWCVGWNSEA